MRQRFFSGVREIHKSGELWKRAALGVENDAPQLQCAYAPPKRHKL